MNEQSLAKYAISPNSPNFSQAKLSSFTVILGDDLHNDFKEMIEACETQLEGETPNSFKWVFWQQQMEALRKTDSRRMRWHP